MHRVVHRDEVIAMGRVGGPAFRLRQPSERPQRSSQSPTFAKSNIRLMACRPKVLPAARRRDIYSSFGASARGRGPPLLDMNRVAYSRHAGLDTFLANMTLSQPGGPKRFVDV